METQKVKRKGLKAFSEDDEEWIVEALNEGYTKKQLAKQYGVSVKTLNKFIKGDGIQVQKISREG